ncbi:MAG: retropepsin-like domain-containing protein [Muribaculaceae bacterium]|nr:retropepsin-like domain-containing protein [Muribaculaceae bacterium]
MQQPLECFTFTGRFPVFRNRISSMIYVSPSRDSSLMQLKVRALWDMGASHTLISKSLADRLDVERSPSTSRLRTALGFETNVPEGEAWITIVLGSFPVKMKVKVTDNVCSDKDIDIVLGLDFIAKGDFLLSTDAGQLMFSFCYPSGFPIDFHEALTNLNIPHAHFEDENADGDLASAIRNGESLKMNYKP